MRTEGDRWSCSFICPFSLIFLDLRLKKLWYISKLTLIFLLSQNEKVKWNELRQTFSLVLPGKINFVSLVRPFFKTLFLCLVSWIAVLLIETFFMAVHALYVYEEYIIMPLFCEGLWTKKLVKYTYLPCLLAMRWLAFRICPSYHLTCKGYRLRNLKREQKHCRPILFISFYFTIRMWDHSTFAWGLKKIVSLWFEWTKKLVESSSCPFSAAIFIYLPLIVPFIMLSQEE